MVLTTTEGFVSKTSKAGDPPMKINLMRISNSNLCPVNALEQYLSISDGVRANRDKLFISYVKPYCDISADTISRWICNLVRNSYKHLSNEAKPLVSAHELRAISASLFVVNESLDEVLNCGLWKNKFSFLNHYKRDISFNTHSESSVLVLNKEIKP